MKARLVIVVGVAVAAGGASRGDEVPAEVLAVLGKADRWEVLSLEPYTPAAAPKEQFRGWEVVGKAAVTDAAARARLLAALKAGVEGHKGDAPRRCFNPRHGIRAAHGGKAVEVLICFSCEKVRAYVPGEGEMNFAVTLETAEAFNQFLKDARVPLPKD